MPTQDHSLLLHALLNNVTLLAGHVTLGNQQQAQDRAGTLAGLLTDMTHMSMHRKNHKMHKGLQTAYVALTQASGLNLAVVKEVRAHICIAFGTTP